MKCRVLFLLILSIELNSFSQSPADPFSWPQFRGYNCSGIAHRDARPPAELNEQTLLWKTEIPEGHSSPCIWGDKLFLTAFIEDSSELQTICMNRHTGEVIWKRSIFPDTIESFHPVSNAAQTSPATDGERVYVYFGSQGILCYSNEGELIWDFRMHVHPYNWGVSSSPIVWEDKVVVSRDIGRERHLFALDKYTGKKIWNTELPDLGTVYTTNFTTPIIYKDQIILHRSDEIAAYSLADGKRTWWLPYLSQGTSTPVVSGGTIYVGTWHHYGEVKSRGNFPDYQEFSSLLNDFDTNGDSLIQWIELPDTLMLAVRPEGSGISTENHSVKQHFGMFDKNKETNGIDHREWKEMVNWITGDFYKAAGLIAIRPEGAGELSIENILWREIDEVPEVPSPVLCNGLIFMCKNGGILTCMDATDGSILYRERIGQKGNHYASPVKANGQIYFPSGTGLITVIRAADTLDILARNDLKEGIFATPAIIGNTIYIRTTGHLYAFGD